MKKRCTVCGNVIAPEDELSTPAGSVCRECVNSMSIYELSELAEDDDIQGFIARLAEFIGVGVR